MVLIPIIIIDNLKGSLDASEATYTNRTNIAPKKIKNKIYANHIDFLERPALPQIKMVWINNVIPMAKGCFICVKFRDIIRMIKEIVINVMSENSLK